MLLVLTSGLTVSAQDRLFVTATARSSEFLTPPVGPLVLFEAPIVSGQFGAPTVAATVPEGGLEPQPLAMAGGQVLLWGPRLLDVATRTVIPVPGLAEHTTQLADPVGLRLFSQASFADGIIVTTAEGARVLPGSASHLLIGVSATGDRLITQRITGSGAAREDVFVSMDAATGAAIREVPLPQFSDVAAVSEGAGAIYVVSGSRLIELDGTTGAPTRELPLPTPPPLMSLGRDVALLDEGRNRLLMPLTFYFLPSTFTRFHWIVDLESWSVIAQPPGGTDWQYDRRRGLVYTARQEAPSKIGTACSAGTLDALDIGTGAIVSSTPLPQGPCFKIALVQAPEAPTLDPATLSGRDVTLSWSLPDPATAVVVEAGSGPGLRDLVNQPVSATSPLIVPGVPPGRYYVRIRAQNGVGASDPSNEIEVIVP